MSSISFDTHFFIKKLVSQGMPEKQAEAVVEFVRETKEQDLNVIASKEDVKLLKTDLRELELKLEQKIIEKILEAKITLIQWMIGLLFIQAGFIITVLKMH